MPGTFVKKPAGAYDVRPLADARVRGRFDQSFPVGSAPCAGLRRLLVRMASRPQMEAGPNRSGSLARRHRQF
jgi:hypothetical protein